MPCDWPPVQSLLPEVQGAAIPVEGTANGADAELRTLEENAKLLHHSVDLQKLWADAPVSAYFTPVSALLR